MILNIKIQSYLVGVAYYTIVQYFYCVILLLNIVCLCNCGIYCRVYKAV